VRLATRGADLGGDLFAPLDSPRTEGDRVAAGAEHTGNRCADPGRGTGNRRGAPGWMLGQVLLRGEIRQDSSLTVRWKVT
jgi:hypothetical protein